MKMKQVGELVELWICKIKKSLLYIKSFSFSWKIFRYNVMQNSGNNENNQIIASINEKNCFAENLGNSGYFVIGGLFWTIFVPQIST